MLKNHSFKSLNWIPVTIFAELIQFGQDPKLRRPRTFWRERLMFHWRIISYFNFTYIAPSANKQTRNYNTEYSSHHPSLSTLISKRWNRRKMKWWAIYTNLSVSSIIRLLHPQSGYSQSQETFIYIHMYVADLYIYKSGFLHRIAGEGGEHFCNSSLPVPPASKKLRELPSAHSLQSDSNREPLISKHKSITTK